MREVIVGLVSVVAYFAFAAGGWNPDAARAHAPFQLFEAR
jgi:hypothetical protein